MVSTASKYHVLWLICMYLYVHYTSKCMQYGVCVHNEPGQYLKWYMNDVTAIWCFIGPHLLEIFWGVSRVQSHSLHCWTIKCFGHSLTSQNTWISMNVIVITSNLGCLNLWEVCCCQIVTENTHTLPKVLVQSVYFDVTESTWNDFKENQIH